MSWKSYDANGLLIETTSASITPGSSSTNQTGPMVQGQVNDTPQSYTDNTVEPISLNLSGQLRTISVTEESMSAWDSLLPDPWNKVAAKSGFDVVNSITIDNVWES